MYKVFFIHKKMFIYIYYKYKDMGRKFNRFQLILVKTIFLNILYNIWITKFKCVRKNFAFNFLIRNVCNNVRLFFLYKCLYNKFNILIKIIHILWEFLILFLKEVKWIKIIPKYIKFRYITPVFRYTKC